MKKLFLSALLVLACLSACQKNEMSAPVAKGEVLYATIEDVASTRTVKDENNNIRWSEGDQIIAFMNSTLGVKYQVLPSSVGETSASFEEVSAGGLNAGTELEHIVAYYPYSSSVKIARSGNNYTLNAVLPSEQIYAPESFGNGTFPMIAVSSTNNLTFKNVCGAMKLQLKGTQKVASIKVEGKNNERLSGAASITAYADGNKPAITMSSDASTSVVLNCGSGIQLNETEATEFIITLPPTLFTKGFVVTISDAAGNRSLIETDKSNEVKRSSVLVMPAVTLENGDIIPQEGDYVDEYGINHGQGIEIDGVVWAPVNCGYHATDFKYGKLYQWGRKYGQGYDGPLYDINGNNCGMYSDASAPEVVKGPTSLSVGQSKDNENKFYYLSPAPSDWCSPQNDNLWNSGTEENPIKTDYDPCPAGWRVPTYAELCELIYHHSSWTIDKHDHNGYWFYGASSYTETSSQVFFPAAGVRVGYDGIANSRGDGARYWSSLQYSNSNYAFHVFFWDGCVSADYNSRTQGYSVRCVQDVSDPTTPSTSNAINLAANGTANSYIVSDAGLYKFTPTKGNSSESVGAVAFAEVLWESFGTDETPNVGDLVKNVKYADGAISFETPSPFKEGNAVIAAKDASGNILWSWHIWLTDEPQVQVYYNNAGTMMDRNLGATSATPGDVGALGLLYQWGRKDPFLGSSSIGKSVEVASTITWPSAVSSNSSNGTIEYAVSYPTTFITYNKNNYDWYYGSSSTSTDNTRWTTSNSAKSIYDPCPSGWRVPDGGGNGIWSKALGSNSTFALSSLYDSTNEGMNFSGKFGSDQTIWYPASGYRDLGDGCLYYVGDNGLYSSASPYSYYWAYHLGFGYDGYGHPSGICEHACGQAVRCVQE